VVGTSRCDVRAESRRNSNQPKRPFFKNGCLATFGFRRLTLRSATGTAQRAIPTEK